MLKRSRFSRPQILLFVVVFALSSYLIGKGVRLAHVVQIMWSDSDVNEVDEAGMQFEAQWRDAEQSVKLHPSDPDAHIKLAIAFSNLGRYEEEKKERQMAAELQSQQHERKSVSPIPPG